VTWIQNSKIKGSLTTSDSNFSYKATTYSCAIQHSLLLLERIINSIIHWGFYELSLFFHQMDMVCLKNYNES